jgi:hypothetical protein
VLAICYRVCDHTRQADAQRSVHLAASSASGLRLEFWRTTGTVAELKFAIGAITMRKMLRRVTLTSVVILVYSGMLPNPVNGGPSESSILEPPSGALFGLYYGAGSLAQTTVKLGRTPAVHLTYYAWAADWTGSVTKADLAEGRIPLVNWEPTTSTSPRLSTGASMQRSWRVRTVPKHSARSSSSTSPPR